MAVTGPVSPSKARVFGRTLNDLQRRFGLSTAAHGYNTSMAVDLDKAREICQLLKAQDPGCTSMRQCCFKVGVPPSTFIGWCDQDPELGKLYGAAADIATDLQFEEIDEIANEEPAVVEGRVDPGWVAWQRVRLDAKKWTKAKRNPKKYGDRVSQEISGKDGGPIQVRSLNDFYADLKPKDKSDGSNI